MTKPQFAVGIDLGTTHCAVATAQLDKPRVRLLSIPQLVGPGELDARELLPSFLYLPAPGEVAPADRALPWSSSSQDGDADAQGGSGGAVSGIVGDFARRLGAKVPHRLVASAKSWVCHGGVNRYAPILPWGAPDSEPHVSPYTAQVAYLAHLRAVWEREHPGASLPEQDVVVTVPASFDEGAREVTTRAAQEAGLGDVRLIEEPQAAFYDFLGAHTDDLPEQLGSARLILVVDVGGGTTDLTLLSVAPAKDGGPQPSRPEIGRIAVGGHLMLGGDNMDAALAVYALKKAGIERPRDASIWSAFVQSARQAKERLLASDGVEQAVISYEARGSRLIGRTKSITIDREEAQRVLLDGFVPATSGTDVASRSARAGLTTSGLPYTSDAAIPRHVCAFLRKHAAAAQEAGATLHDGLPRPDLLLLNGGVFNAHALTKRLDEVFAGWFDGKAIPRLEHTSLETAVARGAVRSALARRGLGELIGGGTARAYYIAVETRGGTTQGLCIAPRGMDEDSSVEVPHRVFDLLLDRPVSFPLYAYTGDRFDPPGTLAELNEELEPLPALETVLRSKGGRQARGAAMPVTLQATLTELGALELYFATVELPPTRWRIDFTLRQPPKQTSGGQERAANEDVVPKVLVDAQAALTDAFRSRDSQDVQGVRRTLEKTLGARASWSVAACRGLTDRLIELSEHRATTADHELNWLRLVGWCMRPGFGAAGDEARLDALWSLIDAGLQHPNKTNWVQWWIAWRRLAPGLDAARQQALFDTIEPWLWRAPQPPPGPHAHGPVEMMQLVAALERLPASAKARAGELFFERAKKLRSYWALGRVGARVAMAGGDVEVVTPDVASQWVARLLELDWDKADGAAFAAASIARLSSDPSRDLPAAVRAQVVERLMRSGAAGSWIDMVERGGEVSAKDAKRVFGDSLPVGLRLS